MNLRAADLILVRGDSFIDRGIELVSHSPYSHTAGIVRDGELIEAQFGRTTGYEPLDAYNGEYDVYTCDTLTDDQRTAIVRWVCREIGTPYDLAVIGYEFIHYLLHFDIPYHEQGKFDCSTLWSNAYKSVGVDLCPNVEYASPGDIANSPLLRKVT